MSKNKLYTLNLKRIKQALSLVKRGETGEAPEASLTQENFRCLKSVKKI